MKFLNKKTIAGFSYEDFHKQWPFPYVGIKGMLTDEGFSTLLKDFPSLELFAYHQNIKGHTGSDRTTAIILPMKRLTLSKVATTIGKLPISNWPKVGPRLSMSFKKILTI